VNFSINTSFLSINRPQWTLASSQMAFFTYFNSEIDAANCALVVVYFFCIFICGIGRKSLPL